MRCLAFDWGRFDHNPDHDNASNAIGCQLENLEIEHVAEEYRGFAHLNAYTF